MFRIRCSYTIAWMEFPKISNYITLLNNTVLKVRSCDWDTHVEDVLRKTWNFLFQEVGQRTVQPQGYPWLKHTWQEKKPNWHFYCPSKDSRGYQLPQNLLAIKKPRVSGEMSMRIPCFKLYSHSVSVPEMKNTLHHFSQLPFQIQKWYQQLLKKPSTGSIKSGWPDKGSLMELAKSKNKT